MRSTLTAQEVKLALGLAPHPREGGWYAQTYAARDFLPPEIFPDGRYASGRRTGTAIYYLLEPGTFSEMHRLRSDEVFHFYAGDSVEQVQLFADGSGTRVLLGNDLPGGEQPQVLVPHGAWQGARLVAGGTWALLGCTVSPGFEFEDYESGEAAHLVAGWPKWEREIRELTRHPQAAANPIV